jgi:hypothetical protein
MKSTDKTDLLEAILVATRDGILNWKQEGPGEYTGTGAVRMTIREIAPLIAGNPETAGTQAFELEVNSMIFTFWSGTSGCDKIGEILAAALPIWSESRALADQRLRDVVGRLRKKSSPKRRDR